NVMKEKDLLTILWFSGPGLYKVLLKGASPSDPALGKQLDKLKSTYGTTCFSEVMAETKEIVEELSELCSNFVVTLFTDGEPVVPWSVKEEETRTELILREFKDRILSFNTIGYGGYYNSNFLKALASLSKFGRHAHSSKINEYLPIFAQNLKSVKNICTARIKLQCPGSSILYTTRVNSRLEKDSLDSSLSSKAENKFYIIHPSKEDFFFNINDQVYNTAKIKSSLTTKHIEGLLYTFAYEEYYKGNSDTALEIVQKTLKDKYLTVLLLNAFTAKERQSCADTLLAAAHDKKLNLTARLWCRARFLEGSLSEEEALQRNSCLMELLEVLGTNGDRYIPLSSDKYRRIGKRVVDNYNVFKIDRSRWVTADFNDLVFTKEKLNVSIRYEIHGFAAINPRQAKAAGFKNNNMPVKMFREQTIIKDGEMNMDTLRALVSSNTMEYLKGLGIRDFFSVLDNTECPYQGYTLIELNLAKIPVISRSYILKNDSLDYILEACFAQRAAECKQKVLKYYLEKAGKVTVHTGQTFTKQQLELLNSYSIDQNGIYHGVDNKIVIEGKDQYQCRFFEFSIKGFSTLPKVDAVISKMKDRNRKLNGPETVMARAIKYITDRGWERNVEELNRRLEDQKSIIRRNTRNLARIKLVKTLTGSWWQGLKADGKDNYLYEKEDKTLVIKVVKKVINI
ncbi:MAG: hypothetical protein Q8930_16945, partial [Bacillota bacterium]|nr:hypothetical protein [Bacillota bacterium]